jgi:hypothetical protein
VGGYYDGGGSYGVGAVQVKGSREGYWVANVEMQTEKTCHYFAFEKIEERASVRENIEVFWKQKIFSQRFGCKKFSISFQDIIKKIQRY